MIRGSRDTDDFGADFAVDERQCRVVRHDFLVDETAVEVVAFALKVVPEKQTTPSRQFSNIYPKNTEPWKSPSQSNS